MKETELAWAAGFFDGEGCTTVNKCKPDKKARDQSRYYASLRASIAQVEKGPLDRFLAAVNVGAVRGPYQYTTNRQPHFQWNASNADVRTVLDCLWPYLSEPKREQATKNIAIYDKYLVDFPPKVNQFGGLRYAKK